jgi:hypothetical protein
MKLHLALFALSLVAGLASQLQAECCDHCGCDCGCRKVCHLKLDKKKVTKVEYSCECEDFCVPCKSECVGHKCECECKPGLCGCMKEKCCSKPVYRPTGATVYTKKKLVKKEVSKEVPVYKWTVETICDGCAHRCRCCENGKTPAQVEAEALAESEAAGEEAEIEPISATAQESSSKNGVKSAWFSALLGKK